MGEIAIAAALAGVGLAGLIGAVIWRALRQTGDGGPESLVGMVGHARTPLSPDGKVFVDGCIWSATNAGMDPIEAGDSVVVQGRSGLTLQVRRKDPEPQPIYKRIPPEDTNRQSES